MTPCILWSGSDQEGNVVSGSIPVTVRLRPVQVPPEFGDGTNRAADLHAFLDAQPDGSTIDFGALRVRADQTLRLDARAGLTIAGGEVYTDDPTGDSSTIAAPSVAARTRSQWILADCDRVTFTGHAVTGPNAAGGFDGPYYSSLEAQHALDIRCSRDVNVLGCTTRRVFGDFVYVANKTIIGSPTYLGQPSERVHIEGLYARQNGRQGIAATGVDGLTIRGCDIDDMRRTLLDFEPTTKAGGVQNVLVEDNTFGRFKLSCISAAGARPTSHVVVQDNTFWAFKGSVGGNSGGRPQDWTVERNIGLNRVSGADGHAWFFTQTDGIVMHGNVQPVDAARNMSFCDLDPDCTDVNISGNTATGAVAEVRWR